MLSLLNWTSIRHRKIYGEVITATVLVPKSIGNCNCQSRNFYRKRALMNWFYLYRPISLKTIYIISFTDSYINNENMYTNIRYTKWIMKLYHRIEIGPSVLEPRCHRGVLSLTTMFADISVKLKTPLCVKVKKTKNFFSSIYTSIFTTLLINETEVSVGILKYLSNDVFSSIHYTRYSNDFQFSVCPGRSSERLNQFLWDFHGRYRRLWTI